MRVSYVRLRVAAVDKPVDVSSGRVSRCGLKRRAFASIAYLLRMPSQAYTVWSPEPCLLVSYCALADGFWQFQPWQPVCATSSANSAQKY